MVGDELITEWHTEKRDGELLHVLTATNSVRDRLSAFLFWKDWNGLEQAIAVARAQRQQVDLAIVESWCKCERQQERFQVSLEELHKGGAT